MQIFFFSESNCLMRKDTLIPIFFLFFGSIVKKSELPRIEIWLPRMELRREKKAWRMVIARGCSQRFELFCEFKMYGPKVMMKKWHKDPQFLSSSPSSSLRVYLFFLMFDSIFSNIEHCFVLPDFWFLQ